MTFSPGNKWYNKDDIQVTIELSALTNNRGFYRVPEMDEFLPKV